VFALPFVRKQFAYLYALQSLINPTFRIAQTTIVLHSLFDREFWVLHLVKPFCCHLSHPSLKRLSFG
jgi:hypothetical protein